jgi:hypothetical protein
MNSTEYLAAVNKYSTLDSKTFTHEIRETSAYIPDQETFWRTIKAGLASECREEIQNVTPAAGAYLPLLRRTFLQLLDEGSIQLIEPISQLAQNEIDPLRRLTGIGAASLPAPVVELTAEQKLDAQIISDFANLPSDAFRAKLSGNVAYRQAYRKLAAEGRISVGKAPATDLDAEVIRSFKEDGTREFKRRCHDNPAFAEAYRRLAETDAISL